MCYDDAFLDAEGWFAAPQCSQAAVSPTCDACGKPSSTAAGDLAVSLGSMWQSMHLYQTGGGFKSQPRVGRDSVFCRQGSVYANMLGLQK